MSFRIHNRRNIVALVAVAVLAHLAVTMFHGRAHEQLAIGLSTWQNVYVMSVILAAPLIAMVLTWTRLARMGLYLLILSMFGALIFGFFYHYVSVSPDNVAHLPPGDARGLFRTTALLLLVTELFGVVVGVVALRGQAARIQHQ